MNKCKQVPKMSTSLRLFKKRKERKAKKTSFLTLSKKYIMTEEFKNELKSFKNTLNEIQKLESLKEQEINEIKNDAKRKLNMLDDEKSNISENLDVDLTSLILRCKILKNFERERELGLSAKEKINKIERLKEEVKNNEDKSLDGEIRFIKLSTDLEYEKNDALLHNNVVLESKLTKLEISLELMDRIKNSTLSS